MWEAALADEIEKGALAGAQAARAAGIEVHDIDPAEQARFDALYLEDAQKNARKLAKLDIDGLDAFRKARASITETGIKCPVQS